MGELYHEKKQRIHKEIRLFSQHQQKNDMILYDGHEVI
jgi:hypothetical protein